MAIPNEYRDIVETLATATNEGRVKWAATKFGIEVAVSGSKFVVWAGTDEEQERGFVSFALSDKDGNTLDNWYVDEGASEYDLMRSLYAGAKRQAMGIPERLANIRNEINKAEIVGVTPQVVSEKW